MSKQSRQHVVVKWRWRIETQQPACHSDTFLSANLFMYSAVPRGVPRYLAPSQEILMPLEEKVSVAR